MTNEYNLATYPFEKNDFRFYFANLFRDRGLKAFYQFLNRPHRRPFSRNIIKTYSPSGVGLEIGVGERTIAPTKRTVLSDGFEEHGVGRSIAKVFFKGATIPYPDESFDFVLNEHVLEHISNPIKCLKEWIRVLKPEGKLIIFLPHKERTNDCHRERTTLAHLIKDFENDVPDDDPTHLDEWWENVVQKGLMPEHYKHIPKDKLLETGSVHHHAWTEKDIEELFEYLGLEVVFSSEKVPDRRDSFLVIGRKNDNREN